MNPDDLATYKEAFLQSAKKHIESLEKDLAELKSGNFSKELIDDLYLHLHSLKGECSTMKFESIATKCEKSLDFLKAEKEKPTNAQDVLNSIENTIQSIKIDINKLNSNQNQTKISQDTTL